MVNDALDKHRIEATVDSVTCNIRKGRCRRINYESDTYRGTPGFNMEWVWNRHGDDEDYVDNMGGSPMISTFPEGTPGIHSKIAYDVVG